MPVLFFNNFRGFDNTFLPLKGVNFFVGENSSGKTSVLKLIKLLSNKQFWFQSDFSFEEVDLGYFNEIASGNSVKKYFELGVLSDFIDKRDEDIDDIIAFKMKFENRDGIPFMKEVSFIVKNLNIQVVFDYEMNFKYRYGKIDNNQLDIEKRLSYFVKWINNNGLINKTYTKSPKKTLFFSQALLMRIQSIISLIEADEKISTPKLSFYFPGFLREMAWLAPIRTDPKRTYDNYKIAFNPNGTHTPYLLKKLIGKESEPANRSKVLSILKKFGNDSGLYDEILIKQLGNEEASPFELQILLNKKPLKITNVGYGVSQILPLIIEILSRDESSWFAIQQPEIHLHPRAQAAFGDFIFKSYFNDGKSFVIETHSDYLIDRFRLKMNRSFNSDNKKVSSTQIVFFYRSENNNHLERIQILPDGTLPEKMPKKYRDFFIKEQLSLIQI